MLRGLINENIDPNIQKENYFKENCKKVGNELKTSKEEALRRFFGKNISNNAPPRGKGLSEINFITLNKNQNKATKLKISPTKIPDAPIHKSDEPFKENPQYVVPYASEILEDLIKNINRNKPINQNITHNQREIDMTMRNILVNWLMEVHERFELLPETLYLTINLLDSYLDKVSVTKKNLQLIGTTCLFIASKYEEIYPPVLDDFVYITKGSTTQEDYIRTERQILKTLNYDILITYPYTLLQRLHFMAGLPKKVLDLANLFIEVSFFDERRYKIDDYVKSTTALYAAKTMCKIKGRFEEIDNVVKRNKKNSKLFTTIIFDSLKEMIRGNCKAITDKYQKYISEIKEMVEKK